VEEKGGRGLEKERKDEKKGSKGDADAGLAC